MAGAGTLPFTGALSQANVSQFKSSVTQAVISGSSVSKHCTIACNAAL